MDEPSDRSLIQRMIAVLAAALFMLASCGETSTPTRPSDSGPPAAAGRYEVSVVGAGVTIGGILYRPEAVDSRPAIIVIHGWLPAGSNGALTVEARARRFAESGFVALAIAMRGWAPSSGIDDCGLRQPEDVVRVADWLRTQPGVAADRVGIVGFSQGGQVALLAAARDPRVAAVVAYYPVTDIALWKATTTNADIPGYITAVCEPGGASSRSPLARLAELRAPVLLVHGDADTRVPTEQSRLMADALLAAGRPAQLLLVPGAAHGFTAVEESFASPVVNQFLTERLR